MTNIKSNQIKSNRYFYIVALSLIACLIFTACNSKPTQVSSFAVIPEDMTNTGPNITPDTTPATETTYTIGVIYPEVRSYLQGQGIDLTAVSTNQTNSANLDKIWKALANSGGKQLYVNAVIGDNYFQPDKTGSSRAALYFDTNGDIYYNFNGIDPKFRNIKLKSFVKAVVVKISDSDAKKLYQTTGSVDGQYTIGAIYKLENTDPTLVSSLKGNGFIPSDYSTYELIYLNGGRSKTAEFNGSNYDSAGFSYDIRYGYNGDPSNDASVYDVENLNTKFPKVSYGLKANDQWSYQTRFYRN